MKENAYIAIEDSPGIGDLVMLTPALRAIKKICPQVTITVLSSNRNSLKVIERLPYIDSVCEISRTDVRKKLHAIKVIAKQDYIIFRAYWALYYWIAFFTQVTYRTGPCKDKYKKWKLLTRFYPYGIPEPNMFKAQYFARRLADDLDIDISIENQCDVSKPTRQEQASAYKKLVENGGGKKPYVVISPFANSGLSMSFSLLREVIECLLMQYKYDIVLLDANEHMEFTKINNKRVINLCGKTSIMEMIALINEEKAAIMTDTGTMHISCALGKNTVVVFSTQTPNEWGPRNNCYPVHIELPCQPCRQKCESKLCMTKITSKMIMTQFDNCIKNDIKEN